MKHLFATIFILLSIASVITYVRLPGRGQVPVLRWATEQGEVRVNQKKVFDRWIARKHGEDPARYPLFEVNIDPANNGDGKLIIQGVAGVAADLYSGSRGAFRAYQSIGLLDDITDLAHARGFSPDETYPALYWEITRNERQYGYPMNVTVPLYLVNARTFRELGVEPPDNGREWTISEFEAKGREFMAAVDKAGRKRKVFFFDKFEPLVLRRAFGLGTFNETGTRCVLDDPRYLHTLQLLHRWTYDYGLLPTSGEAEALVGGVGRQFCKGGYGMWYEGSWCLEGIRPREDRLDEVEDKGARAKRFTLHDFRPGDLLGVPPPRADGQEGITNTILRARICSVYAGGKHRAEGARFLEFLASDDYARQLIVEPDSLPPNPHMIDPANPDSALFYRPNRRIPAMGDRNVLDYEWPVNPVFEKAAWEWAVGTNYSEFVLPNVASRIETDAYKDFIAGSMTAEQASQRITMAINAEIVRTIAANPLLQKRYEELVARQAQITAYRGAGRKVPVGWLEDPFYQRYWLRRGWAEGASRIDVPAEQRYVHFRQPAAGGVR